MIILAAVCWGIIGIFYRRLSACGFSPIQIVFIRVGVAALVMTLYLLAADRDKLKIRLRDSLWFVGTGMCSLVFFNWCYFHAMDQSSLAVAAVLLYTAPAFVLLMSVLCFGERMSFRKLAALLVVFAGIMLVSGVFEPGSAQLSLSGILFGLGSGFGYALYSILGTVLLKKYPPETVSVYTFIFAAAGSALLMAVSAMPTADVFTGMAAAEAGASGSTASGVAEVGAIASGLGSAAIDLAAVNQPQVWISALGIGVVCSMLPFTFYTKGLTAVPASRAAVMATLEPVVAALTGVVFFREAMDMGRLFGILLILGGILLLGSDRAKKKS